MKRKMLALLTASMLFTSAVFTGCSGKTAVEQKQSSSTPAATNANMVGNMYKTGLPIVKDKVTLKMIVPVYPGHGKFDDMPFFKNLEEKTNVHVQWDTLPEASYNEKKNILLAANELPDAFMGSKAFTIDDANKYGPMGTVIPLDDLIEKYAPNYKDSLGKLPLLSGLTTCFDGKKYTMGTVIENEIRNFPDNLFINKAWLDKLNLKIPTTLDEYYEVLKAFKEKDPNGNGKKDEIPFTFTKWDQIRGYGSFFGAFGRVEAHNGSAITPFDHFIVEDGKVVFDADKPEYKEAIKYLSKFFKEDLFDKEGLTQDQSQYEAKTRAPGMIVGSVYNWAPSLISTPENAKNYIAIPPLKGPSGKDPVVRKRNNNINYQASGFAISKTNKYPEITVRWADQFFDVKTGIESQWGPVGVTLKDKGNNTFDFMPAPQGIDFTEFAQKNAPYDVSPKVITKDMLGKVIPYDQSSVEKMDAISKYYANAKKSESLPLMNFKTEEIKVSQTVGMDVCNMVREKQVKWLLDGTIDQEWDAYIAKLKQLKVDDYVKQMQAVYDRTSGKK